MPPAHDLKETAPYECTIETQIGMCNAHKKQKVFFAYAIPVVILTLLHRHNTMQSVVAGQASETLGWKNNTHDI